MGSSFACLQGAIVSHRELFDVGEILLVSYFGIFWFFGGARAQQILSVRIEQNCSSQVPNLCEVTVGCFTYSD
jgi:hypothetical protein